MTALARRGRTPRVLPGRGCQDGRGTSRGTGQSFFQTRRFSRNAPPGIRKEVGNACSATYSEITPCSVNAMSSNSTIVSTAIGSAATAARALPAAPSSTPADPKHTTAARPAGNGRIASDGAEDPGTQHPPAAMARLFTRVSHRPAQSYHVTNDGICKRRRQLRTAIPLASKGVPE